EPPTVPAISGPSPISHLVKVAASVPDGLWAGSLTMVSISGPSDADPLVASGQGVNGEPSGHHTPVVSGPRRARRGGGYCPEGVMAGASGGRVGSGRGPSPASGRRARRPRGRRLVRWRLRAGRLRGRRGGRDRRGHRNRPR